MATETLRPNAAGDETSIASQTPASDFHWDKVDEASADAGTTYVSTANSASYERDLYNLPASSGSGTINFIKIYAEGQSVTDVGFVKLSLKSGTTVTDGTAQSVGTTGWTKRSQQWSTNPDDSAAWEWSDIDALQIGMSLIAGSGASIKCTQVYVEVDYSIPVIVTPGTLSLTLTTYAPTVTATANVLVTPATLNLVLTTYAPTVSVGRTVIPTTLNLVLTTYAPSVLTPRLITPPTLNLTLTTYAPTINIGRTVIPPTLNLVLTTYAPTISIIPVVLSAIKYILELHTASTGNLVSILENAFDISYVQVINKPAELKFSLPADDTKRADLTITNEIWIRDYVTGAVVKKFRLSRQRDNRK